MAAISSVTTDYRTYSILGFGVSLAIKGDYADKTSDFGIGLGLAIGGLLAVIAAALGFGAAVSMINKRWVRTASLPLLSIALMSCTSCLSGHYLQMLFNRRRSLYLTRIRIETVFRQRREADV